MDERLNSIRDAEAKSHTEAYRTFELFTPGSWLAKPVKTVLDILPLFDGYAEFCALDLGSGVGRNSIPVANYFKHIPCHVDCVDVLDVAIEKLNESAQRYGVADNIHGVVSLIDDYDVQANRYDLIMGISALEHINSKDAFVEKLVEIRNGLRDNGIACLIVNTGVRERDKITNENLYPQFEVNLPTDEMQNITERIFEGCKIIKNTVVHRKYDTPRMDGISILETDVVTCVYRKSFCM